MLEIIALTVDDAIAAEQGGADRVEVVADMSSGGLTPAPDAVAEIGAAVEIPMRVMLRTNSGFTVSAEELHTLVDSVDSLRAAGAREFVLGFLTPAGEVDLAATEKVVAALDGAPWTLHRAIDRAADAARAWTELADLPGLDTVLTAGSPRGVPAGLPVLRSRVTWENSGVRILVGGGLHLHHLPELRAMGITAVHASGAVRRDPAGAVDATLVHELRRALDAD